MVISLQTPSLIDHQSGCSYQSVIHGGELQRVRNIHGTEIDAPRSDGNISDFRKEEQNLTRTQPSSGMTDPFGSVGSVWVQPR